MTDFTSPVQVEESIREISNRIAKSVQICAERYAAFLESDRSYDRAFAVAYMAHPGPAHEKRYAAEIATGKERELKDAADVMYKHADRLAKALDLELRALQSIGASLRAQYQVAGRGEY